MKCFDNHSFDLINLEQKTNDIIKCICKKCVRTLAGDIAVHVIDIACILTYIVSTVIPVNTKHLCSIYTMSAQSLRRWTNIV